MVLLDIGPDTVRRPGAMTLNTLYRNMSIISQGGSRTLESVECEMALRKAHFYKQFGKNFSEPTFSASLVTVRGFDLQQWIMRGGGVVGQGLK